MSIMKSSNGKELIVNCSCGCDKGIHLTIDDVDNAGSVYCITSFMSGDWYNEQKIPFMAKIKKIWAILRNKDYYYSEICMNTEDFNTFKEYVNKF